MATPQGEVVFEADGVRHVLRYGINELCRLEDRLNTPVTALAAVMAAGLDMRTLRTIFACGLDGDVTDSKAGEIIGSRVQMAGDKVGEAMRAAFPQESGAQKDGAAANPRKAATGTGSTS